MIFPAADTPPPIINISGAITLAMLESAVPRYAANISTVLRAFSSPAFAASNISFAVRFSLQIPNLLCAMSTIPVADAYCSRQPLQPQPHA